MAATVWSCMTEPVDDCIIGSYYITTTSYVTVAIVGFFFVWFYHSVLTIRNKILSIDSI